ncbi:MAG: U32 family peptidase [Ignavibacteria bacterium]|nr:U32 family peptidase [Ignavibacteria bacterium]
MNFNRQIELLSPAKNADYGIAAINCGADAVYIGAPKFGARAAAGNSLEDISKLIKYAHKYRVKVYSALNTILFDNEISEAVKIINRLYEEGIDAIIFQDMALLEVELPPVALHASTQTHNYQTERINFLDRQNIQRIILARELSLEEIKNIKKETKCELEYFIHGALCVCFSGQCYLSNEIGGRSANRGECAQPCRLSYNLLDSSGNIIVKDKHLLSLKDLNLSTHLYELISAGISSFKIEGRLKDLAYVKNITAYYRRKLDEILENMPDYKKSSTGKSEIKFEPDPDITFNRGFTTYFFNGRKENISSMDSPKSKGKFIGKVIKTSDDFFVIDTEVQLSNGDGLYIFKDETEICGMYINKSEKNKVFKDISIKIPEGAEVYRNLDSAFMKAINRNDEQRKIAADIVISGIEKGIKIKLEFQEAFENSFVYESEFEVQMETASNPEKMKETIIKQFSKSGDSVFEIENVKLEMSEIYFLKVSAINEIRRNFINLAEEELIKTHPFERRIKTGNDVLYFEKKIKYNGNVVNRLSEKFYKNHGVESISKGPEISGSDANIALMTCKYCIKNELNICPKDKNSKEIKLNEPHFLENEYGKFQLKFDCSKCEMQVIKT